MMVALTRPAVWLCRTAPTLPAMLCCCLSAGNWETLRFLLSNARWWIDEYKWVWGRPGAAEAGSGLPDTSCRCCCDC